MKKSEIKIGAEYAVKLATNDIVRATIIRPVKSHPGRWVAIREGATTAGDRTFDVYSQSIIAPWLRYCVDTAHAEAIREEARRRQEEKDATEREARAQRLAPYINTLRGIEVQTDPPRDLGELLHQRLVESGMQTTTVGFSVWEAVAKEIALLRERLVAAGGEWGGDAQDTGIPEVMTAELDPILSGLARVQAQLAKLEDQPPAGVSNEADPAEFDLNPPDHDKLNGD